MAVTHALQVLVAMAVALTASAELCVDRVTMCCPKDTVLESWHPEIGCSSSARNIDNHAGSCLADHAIHNWRVMEYVSCKTLATACALSGTYPNSRQGPAAYTNATAAQWCEWSEECSARHADCLHNQNPTPSPTEEQTSFETLKDEHGADGYCEGTTLGNEVSGTEQEAMLACIHNSDCTGFFYGHSEPNDADRYWLMSDMTHNVISNYQNSPDYAGYTLTCVDKYVPPTQAPTAVPTTSVPTDAPTASPTDVPTTGEPSTSPTSAPSETPTVAPTATPTAMPTVECDPRTTAISIPELREQFRSTVDANSPSIGGDWRSGDLDIVELREAVRALGECELFRVVSASDADSHVTLQEFCDQLIDVETCAGYHANNLNDDLSGVLCVGADCGTMSPSALPTEAPTKPVEHRAHLVIPAPEELPADLQDNEPVEFDDDWTPYVMLPAHTYLENGGVGEMEGGGWLEQHDTIDEEGLYRIDCTEPVTFESQLHFEFSVPEWAGLEDNKALYRAAVASTLDITESRVEMRVRTTVRRRLFYAEIVKVILEAENKQDITNMKAAILQGHFSHHMAYYLRVNSEIGGHLGVVAGQLQVFENTFATALNPKCSAVSIVQTSLPTASPTSQPTFEAGGPPPGAHFATAGPPVGAHEATVDGSGGPPPVGATLASMKDDDDLHFWHNRDHSNLGSPPSGASMAGMDDDRVWDSATPEEGFTWHGDAAVGSAVDVLHSARDEQSLATANAAAQAAAAAAARDDDDLYSHLIPTLTPTATPTADSILSLLASLHTPKPRTTSTGVADMFKNHAIAKAQHSWTPLEVISGEEADVAVDNQAVHDLTDGQMSAVAHPADVPAYTHGVTNCEGVTITEIPTEPLTCTMISGNINIVDSDLTSLDFLSNVEQVNGAIVIQNCPELTSISGMSKIVSLGSDEHGNSLVIEGADKLVSMSELGLLFVTGSVQILQNSELASVDGLQSLVNVGANNNGVSVQVVENLKLANIALPSLHGELAGALHIARNPLLTDISSLVHITGLGHDSSGVSLLISHNDALPDTAGLNGVHTYSGSVEVANNLALTKVKSILDNIESVGKNLNGVSFQFRNNAALRSLSVVHHLPIPGSVIVAGNPALSRVSFSGIESIGSDENHNSLVFANNNKLSRYADHHPSTTGAVTVDMNPKLHTLMEGAICEVSLFGQWSQCSRQCGGGFHARRRKVITPGPMCPILEFLVECNTHPCNACSTGDDVDVVWHSNVNLHNHITHTYNILSDHRGTFRGRPNWGQTKMGRGKTGSVTGHFDLGKTGPWEVQFAIVSSERKYPSSIDDYIDIHVGGAIVTRKYNTLEVGKEEIVSFYTALPYVNYTLTWHSTVEDPDGHMEVLSGVATCQETSQPTPAPTPAGICGKTYCTRTPGTKSFTTSHDSEEDRGSVNRCGFEGTADPETTGACVCRCSDAKFGENGHEELARIRQQEQFPTNSHPNLRGADGNPAAGGFELQNFIPMRIHELSGMHEVAAP